MRDNGYSTVRRIRRYEGFGASFPMTDKLAGKDDSQRLLGYVESVAKESRKALTLEFNEKHKGIPFNTSRDRFSVIVSLPGSDDGTRI